MSTPCVMRYCYVLLFSLCTMFLVNILPTRIGKKKKNLELFIESITLCIMFFATCIFSIYIHIIFIVYVICTLIDTI